MSEKKIKKAFDELKNWMLTDKIESIEKYFRNLMQEQEVYEKSMEEPYPWNCEFGLNVHFSINDSSCYIDLDLDHLDNTKITELLDAGKLFAEVMILYKLAHLPFARGYTLNICVSDAYFDIIDRVRINLHQAFHPFEKEKYYKKYQSEEISETIKKISEIKDEMHPYLGTEPKVEKGIEWIKKHQKDKK